MTQPTNCRDLVCQFAVEAKTLVCYHHVSFGVDLRDGSGDAIHLHVGIRVILGDVSTA